MGDRRPPPVYRDPESGRTFSVQPRMPSRRRHESDCSGCITGTVIFLFVVVIGVAILSGLAFNNSIASSTSVLLSQSGAIANRPHSVAIDGTSPVAATLPNDLLNYVGRTFYMYSVSAQPHTITILAGTLATTWDGTNTIATLGGAIGDGVTFHVLARDKIVIISNTNAIFSS